MALSLAGALALPACDNGLGPTQGSGGAKGSGGAVAGTGGVSGSGGASAGTGGAGTGGATGAGGAGSGGRATGSGGGGGAMSCAGNAIAFNANVPANNDPAKARVMVDFGTMDLPVGSSQRTIEFWAFIRTSSWAGDANTMFEYGDQSVSNAGFGLDFGGQPGTLDPYTNGTFDNDNQSSGLTATMDQWAHLAVTYDGTAVRLYVNGTMRAMKTSPGNMLATARTQLTIGGNPRGAYFNGYIDEFRVWNVARTAAEISGAMSHTLTGAETGLVGYWKFDESSVNSAADSVTTAGHTKHNGTLMSTMASQLPTFIPSTAPITSCP